MNSVEITIRLSKTVLSDIESITVTTSEGDLQFMRTAPVTAGTFSSTYFNLAPGKFAILTEVPPDGLESSPGPVDDPGR